MVVDLKEGPKGLYFTPFPVLGLCGDGKQIFLTAGGGGATASKEVPNLVQVHKYDEETGQLSTIGSLNTVKSVVINITYAEALGLWLASALGACKVLEFKQHNSSLTEVREFVTEKEGKEQTQTVARCSAAGDMVATGGSDGAVRIWKVEKRFLEEPSLLHECNKHKEITELDFSPDGTLLVSSDKTGAARIWDTATGAQKKEIRYKSPSGDRAELPIRGVKFIPGASGPIVVITAAAARGNGVVCLYSQDGDKIREVVADPMPLTCLGVNSSSKLVAVGSVGGTKTVLSLPGLSKVKSLKNCHDLPAPCVAFVGESTVITGSGDRCIHVMSFKRTPLLSAATWYTILIMLLLAFIAWYFVRISSYAVTRGGKSDL